MFEKQSPEMANGFSILETIFVSAEQSENAFDLICCTDLPMVSDVKLLHLANASIAMTVTLLGMAIDSRAEHPSNELPSIVVRELGSNADFRPLQR
jgi:hypothetical protein